MRLLNYILSDTFCYNMNKVNCDNTVYPILVQINMQFKLINGRFEIIWHCLFIQQLNCVTLKLFKFILKQHN